jgi:hypothetical protein
MAYGNGGGKPKYEHKVNRGSMFDNDHKTTEKHPDFTGSVNVEGTVYWISGWTGFTNTNKRKLTLSVKRQDERPQERPQQGRQPSQKTSW